MFKRILFILIVSLAFTHLTSAQDQSPKSETSESKTGYFNTTELSYSKGFLKENSSWYGGLQTINGYRFNEHVSAGIGVGVDQYFFNINQQKGTETGETYLPVFTDVRFFIGKGKTQPYFSQAVGYMFCLFNNYEGRSLKNVKNIGGIMINPSFGVSTPISEKTSLNIGLGYRFQEVTIKGISYIFSDMNDPLNFRSSRTFPAHYLTLKAGVTF